MYLLALDSTGTQPYIFGSNRLRHNIGASHLVAQATGSWALEVLPKPNNVECAARLRLQPSEDDEYWIEKNGSLAAEVIYAGGGNVVVLFRGKEQANAFRKHLSGWLIERAPELTLVEAGAPFDWKLQQEKDISDSPLSRALDAVLRKLGRKKAARRIPPRPVNHSVTLRGQIYGQPAVAWQHPPRDADEDEDGDLDSDDDSYPISAEAKAKEDYLDRAHERLQELLPLPDGYAYPFKLDNLGRAKGAQSFIAVVHADGDRMGELLHAVAEQSWPEDMDRDRAFIHRMRAFSEEVREAALDSMKDVVEGLCAFIDRRGATGEDVVELTDVKAPLRLSRRDGQRLVPLRPIVFGGDDVTFVCDGRLGLALAVRYVRRFEEHAEKKKVLGSSSKVTASAGVAIVKTHYPFARAYDLAGALTRSAKDKREAMDPVGACMDWHIAHSDLAGSLDAIRRQYRVDGPGEAFTVRPVAVTGGGDSDIDRWEIIRTGVEGFRSSAYSRTKIEQLREKLVQGPGAVRSFVQKYRSLPDLSVSTNIEGQGYYSGETPYLDMLELTDFAVLDDTLEACEGASPDANRSQ